MTFNGDFRWNLDEREVTFNEDLEWMSDAILDFHLEHWSEVWSIVHADV